MRKWAVWSLLGVSLAVHGAQFQNPFDAGAARANALQSLDYATLHPGTFIIKIGLKHAPSTFPTGFRTLHPAARIVLDFPDTAIALEQKSIQVDRGMVRSIRLLQHESHVRLVINLTGPASYETAMERNNLLITLLRTPVAPVFVQRQHFGAAEPGARRHRVHEVQFERGQPREGRITVNFSDALAGIAIREQGRLIIVDFLDADIAPGSQKRLDVLDFATPVVAVEARAAGSHVRMLIEASAPFEYSAYQAGSQFILRVNPAREEQRLAARR